MWANHTASGNYIIYVDGEKPSSGGTAILANEIPADTPLDRIKGSYRAGNYWSTRSTYTLSNNRRDRLAERGVTTFGGLVQFLIQDFDEAFECLKGDGYGCPKFKNYIKKVADWFSNEYPDYGPEYKAPVVLRFDTPIEYIVFDSDSFGSMGLDSLSKEEKANIREYIVNGIANTSDFIAQALKSFYVNEAARAREKLAEIERVLGSLEQS